MIFVTVGTQLPFDRMVAAADTWAKQHPEVRVVAQVGQAQRTFDVVEAHASLSLEAFDKHVQEADVVIAHAGIGSILTALRLCKPVIIMPRRAAMGEHRNDHQLSTCKRFMGRPGVYVAEDESALADVLDAIQGADAPPTIPPYASEKLLSRIGAFIRDDKMIESDGGEAHMPDPNRSEI